MPAGVPVRAKVKPEDVPPPTPITLPRFQPFAQEDAALHPSKALSEALKHPERTNSLLGPQGMGAIGLDLAPDAPVEDLIPDPSYIPDFKQWELLTADEAQEKNQSTRRPLRNGNLSPGCQVYLERRKELSIDNRDGFRTVRRIAPPKGKQQARLGNAYEFFRCLEVFTAFWDDPTQPPVEPPPSPEASSSSETPPVSEDSRVETSTDAFEGSFRTSSGSSMPPEYRNSLTTALIKLVAYDFGCSVSPARVEPRLQASTEVGWAHPRKSYVPSACTFIFQAPTTREAARAGHVHGPVAAVSSRPTVDFASPDVETAQSLDLAREMIAAFITAQHRAREGKTERRFGDGQWWTSKPRWGGGQGGPIGREMDKYAVQGDKEEGSCDGSDGMPRPVAKKPRKNMSSYDSYRMVRPPASTWDKRAKYEAIGKPSGSDYDDIFLVSSLFHHISIMRVRVPNRLLEVLDGSAESDPTSRSWGKVQAWRSPWYDLFEADQRIAAVQTLWCVMAYQMRDTGGSDVAMRDR